MPSNSSCQTNDLVHWVIRFALLVYAAFVADRLPLRVAILFDNTVVRVVLVALVLALGTCDPASAILLSVGLVLSIQSANKHHLSKIANHAVVVGRETFQADNRESDAEDPSKDPSGDHVEDHSKGHSDDHSKSHSDDHSKSHSEDHSESHSEDHSEGHREGFSTSAQHSTAPMSGQVDHQPTSRMFISPEQLNAMQTNHVADNQNTEVRTWKQEIGPQGLGTAVSGFSFGSPGGPAPFQ